MGWSGPGRKRHRAVRMRVGHACDGGTSLPGWLEGACAFGRSARLRVGSVRFSGHGGPGCRAGGRAATLAGQAARRGWRHGSAPYASIADDSEVDCDRPIKCCDDIHSISHYRPAATIRGRHALRGVPTIREILTAAMFAQCASAATRQRGNAARHALVSMHPVTQGEAKAVDTCAAADRGVRVARRRSRQVGTSRRVEEKAGVIRPTPSARIGTRHAISSRSGENSRRRIAGPSIGHLAAAD